MSLIETTLKNGIAPRLFAPALAAFSTNRTANQPFFPLERLPLCLHPQVAALGEQALRYIQVQTLYQYLHGIANIELDIINDSSYKLYKNAVGVDFPLEMRLDALTVVVDESYHALVALDLINQVEQMTSIAPLPMPKTPRLPMPWRKRWQWETSGCANCCDWSAFLCQSRR